VNMDWASTALPAESPSWLSLLNSGKIHIDTLLSALHILIMFNSFGV